VIVDLSQTRAIDARFFGLLLMLRKQLTGKGTTLRFQGASQRLRRQFQLNSIEYLLISGQA
jgi:N-acetylglucosaminyldiphosphoundecaprenol N-acetyl-beta-D-mannosaminyltransferase